MWEFRRRPEELSAEEKQKLEELFAKLPKLKTLYELRLRFQHIFDTVEVVRNEVGEKITSVDPESVPPQSSDRLIAAFGERSDNQVGSVLYKTFLKNYSGSDYPVLEFAQRQAMRLLFVKDEESLTHLSIIERSYSAQGERIKISHGQG
jgi:hypothetical protein